jgi:CO/xanthine dehydrogenase Mo-binding subunit
VENQVQGGTVQSLSWALHELLPQNKQIITAVNWITYPILRYEEVPDITVTLINRPAMGTSGVGEPASMGMGAVLSNAIFDATGVRLRATPFTPARVLAALKNA